jgi:hypothetical protein
MFELSAAEVDDLVSQSVIPRRGKLGGAVPMAFTEQGVAMLSSVLRSKRAVQVNISIMRAFVRLRELLLSHADLARKLEALEKKYDGQFRLVFDAIRQLMEPPDAGSGKEIGFHVREEATRWKVCAKSRKPSASFRTCPSCSSAFPRKLSWKNRPAVTAASAWLRGKAFGQG